jgi:hypothetical protein
VKKLDGGSFVEEEEDGKKPIIIRGVQYSRWSLSKILAVPPPPLRNHGVAARHAGNELM